MYGMPNPAVSTNSCRPILMPRRLLGAEIIAASTNPLLTEISSSGMPPRSPNTARSLPRCSPHFSRSKLSTRSGESPRLVTPIFLPFKSSGFCRPGFDIRENTATLMVLAINARSAPRSADRTTEGGEARTNCTSPASSASIETPRM
jgi:hypothetical protein